MGKGAVFRGIPRVLTHIITQPELSGVDPGGHATWSPRQCTPGEEIERNGRDSESRSIASIR